ncbi:hypothetical protein PSPO_b1415 [Pseudoalteromonas spongiae UST010723-006]|nr:hypothetical protein PSPO_b1415 [Pseudoalteromonas spongiae UST010723-006]
MLILSQNTLNKVMFTFGLSGLAQYLQLSGSRFNNARRSLSLSGLLQQGHERVTNSFNMA